jgi:ribosome biogenesis GTPase A
VQQSTSRGVASQETEGGRNNAAANTVGGIVVTTSRKGKKQSGYCYGCGADLVRAGTSGGSEEGLIQTVTKKKGYFHTKQEELKKSKISNWALCPRCRKLQKAAKNSSHLAAEELMNLAPNSKMTQIFRTEVSKIRSKQNAVVILCVDAVNTIGTVIRSIRNYVGGNPILLAVTRCDLLPAYVWERHGDSLDSLKQVFRQRASDIVPAAVYLCSEDANYKRKTGGLHELTQDLWNNLNGRDPYVVGAANIGKSTLTDILIARLASKGEKLGHFKDRLASKRVDALRRSQITKSSLPGTTLQNVRVPCFQDHTQALWDTPGLLLDESLKHFPIRNLRAIRAQRPSQIQPQIFESLEEAFCLLICEKGDDLPLLRIEIRLKRNVEGEGPVRLVWNSFLNLESKIMDIVAAREDERQREIDVQLEADRKKQEQRQVEKELENLSKEERQRRKEQRRTEHNERMKKEMSEMGDHEWKRHQDRMKIDFENAKRLLDLAKLVEVNQFLLERKIGTDIAVANFGWLGVVVPRTALIKVFAPSSGVRATSYPTVGLPLEFGEYINKASDIENIPEDDSNEDLSDDDYNEDLSDDGNVWDLSDDYDLLSDESYDDFREWDEDNGGCVEDESPYSRLVKETVSKDVWAKYSGENVGWQFDADGRFLKGDLEEGWNPLRKGKIPRNRV